MTEEKALIRLCVVGIVINKDKKFLFLKRLFPSDLWVPPCGGVRKREKITDALDREIFEEAGIKVKIKKIVDVWQGFHEDEEVFSVTYLCEAIDDKVNISDEHQDYKWVSAGDLHKIKTDFNVQNWPNYL
jgi:8-oxo-dGTP diphosphatase